MSHSCKYGKYFKKVGFGLIVLFALTSCRQEKKMQPNILFAIADDWSFYHSSYENYPEIHTPNFDKVANQGIYFQRAYCNAPSCTASRASILTGKNGWELKEGGVLWGLLPIEFEVYPELLEENGYHVGYTGKGWAPGSIEAAGRTQNPAGKAYNDLKKEMYPELKIEKGTVSMIDYAANFEQFLESRIKDQPFCFWYGGWEPHRKYDDGIGKRVGKDPTKLILPRSFPDDSITRSDVLDYLFEVEIFDLHLGRMLHHLEDIGELENTLVLVTSDNGMPFPRSKANLYEYGTHMPLAIMWKGRVKGGRKVMDIVNLADIAPTVLEAAGLEIPKAMTSKSLLPLVLSDKEGQIDPKHNWTVTYRERHAWVHPGGAIAPVRALRQDDWLLIWNLIPEMWPAGDIDPQYNFNQTAFGDCDNGPTKFDIMALEDASPVFYQKAFGKRPEYELYNIAEDPYQMNNLVDDDNYNGLLTDLQKKLKDYLQTTKDPRIVGGDSVFVNTPYFGHRK